MNRLHFHADLDDPGALVAAVAAASGQSDVRVGGLERQYDTPAAMHTHGREVDMCHVFTMPYPMLKLGQEQRVTRGR